MKVMIINPPRFYWPFMHEGDNYLLPQALPCLAAVLRENDIEVKPLDCLPLRIGWKTLRKIIEKENPDVIGIATSETMFSHEALKLSKLAKEIDSDITTVLGGHHFSALPSETLEQSFVDFVVMGEGDYTFLEIVKQLEKPNPIFKKIKGIGFKNNGKIIITKPRPLINNLDELPIPAYDLMPMKMYGKGPLLWSPGGTTIYHSRGCIGNCSFCACWVHMSERKLTNNNYICYPRWRTKSPKRTVGEVELLYEKYKKKFLVFVDDTWNVDPQWSLEFSNLIKEKGIDVQWYAFIRADFLVRDEEIGVLKNIIDAGLSHVCIGVERASNDELLLLKKGGYNRDVIKKAFDILKNKYPHVFRQATFIAGFRNETKKSLYQLLQYAKEIDADFPSFHPITPVPGTETWNNAIKNNWLEITDFKFYDWMTPLMSSESLSRKEIETILIDMNRKYLTPNRLIKGLMNKGKHKRRLYLWCIVIAAKLILDEMKKKVHQREDDENKKLDYFMKMVKPKWYNK